MELTDKDLELIFDGAEFEYKFLGPKTPLSELISDGKFFLVDLSDFQGGASFGYLRDYDDILFFDFGTGARFSDKIRHEANTLARPIEILKIWDLP